MPKKSPTKKRGGCRNWLLIIFGLIVLGAIVSPRNQTAIYPVDTPESPKRAATAAATVNVVIEASTATRASRATSTTDSKPAIDTAATAAADATQTLAALYKTATAISLRPSATSKPTVASTRLPTRVPATAAPAAVIPTQAPTAIPAAPPTVAQPAAPVVAPPPADPGQPTYSGKTVSPAWWPCVQGQIKGNRNSMIYHVPTGRDYARTYANVQCFNTESEAQGGGYRRAQR